MQVTVPKKIVAQRALASSILSACGATDLDVLRDRYIIRMADHPKVEFIVRLTADMSPLPHPKWKVRAMAQGQLDEEEIGGADYLLFADYQFRPDWVYLSVRIVSVKTQIYYRMAIASGEYSGDESIFTHTAKAIRDLGVMFGRPRHV